MNISRCRFNSNKAQDGGAIYESVLSIFRANRDASEVVLQKYTATVNIDISNFSYNKAEYNGGAIYAAIEFGAMKISGSKFSNNKAYLWGGAVYTIMGSVNIDTSEFTKNTIRFHGGAIHAQRTTVIISGNKFSGNGAEAGVVYFFESVVSFLCDVTFINNSGSIFLFRSNLTITEGSSTEVTSSSFQIQRFSGASTLKQGGVFTTFQSIIFFNGICTLMDNHAKDGGAIYATETKLFVYGRLTIANNTATDSGGGVYLYHSELNCKENCVLEILGNRAIEKGGGIHATSSLILMEFSPNSESSVLFIANDAKMGGGVCLEISTKFYILKRDYSDREHYPLIYSANTAQYGGAVYVADDFNSGACASISYTVYSTLTECSIQTLAVYDNTITDEIIFLKNINFTENKALVSGSTIFGGLLDRCTVSPFAEVYRKYNDETASRPDIIDGVTYLKSMSTIIETDAISSHPVKNCFCIDDHHNCKFHSFSTHVKKGEIFSVSLVAVDQVNHTVNATIHSSLSSNLGGLGEDQSSQSSIESCTTLKFSILSPCEFEKLILLALVAILLCLNLTVATGTLNGIIFYANIINANSSTFLPFTEPNFITVFIAWLNLGLGIDTCLFKGMDTYWKMTLQLVFPAYVILLVVMVICISERSTRFAQLIGRKNPVATLATLILLSFTKFLHTTIAALSFSILDYPDGSREVVWLPDGTISYLSGKHVLLFITAILILLAGVAYTSLLFSWQWLIYYQLKILKWAKHHKLSLFLEPYHAPYKFKHRYWTGLLLLVRAVLYIASALNVSRSPRVDLLVTGIVMMSLLLLKGHVGNKSSIYRKWLVDVLETACYVNIITLSFARLYTLEKNEDQTIVAYISGTITLALFLVVFIYHIFTEVCFKTKLCTQLRQTRRTPTDHDEVLLIDYPLAYSELRDPPQPTVSWIDAPSHGEQPPTHSTDK